MVRFGVFSCVLTRTDVQPSWAEPTASLTSSAAAGEVTAISTEDCSACVKNLVGLLESVFV